MQPQSVQEEDLSQTPAAGSTNEDVIQSDLESSGSANLDADMDSLEQSL
jgi:hypothetical protein